MPLPGRKILFFFLCSDEKKTTSGLLGLVGTLRVPLAGCPAPAFQAAQSLHPSTSTHLLKLLLPPLLLENFSLCSLSRIPGFKHPICEFLYVFLLLKAFCHPQQASCY